MPYIVLSLWAPLARALGVFGSVPVPLVAALGTISGIVLVMLVPRLAALLPASLDQWFDPEHRKLAVPWAIGCLIVLVQFGRNAVFLADPSLVGYSLIPSDEFLVRHSCLTAYMHGAILSMDPAANVYDIAYVAVVVEEAATLPPTAEHFAPFMLDAYGYPPSFLLLPRALLWMTSDFLTQRLLFGAGSLLLLLLACGCAARTLGGVAERRIWLLTPIFLATSVVIATVQVGNFHAATVALCLLCWVALERRRDDLAGVLLAVATLAKIFPGLLGVLLLVQRRWRAVGFTCLAAAIIGGLSVAVLGLDVWHDFFSYHLPKVQSGEALGFMTGTTREIAFNSAPFGIPHKLAALGFDSWGWDQARLFGNVYTVLLFILAVLAGRKSGSPQHRLSAWMAIVLFASLQSPYAPPFILLTMSVLFLVLVAEVRSRWGTVGFVAIVFVIIGPMLGSTHETMIVMSFVRMIALYGLCLYLVVRKEVSPTPSPGQSLPA